MNKMATLGYDIFYTKGVNLQFVLITIYTKLGLWPRFLQKYIIRPYMAISSSLGPQMRPIPGCTFST